MKIIALIGSPRKNGNTVTLVGEVLAVAAEKGAQSSVYHLNEMNVKGCQSCYACKSHGKCLVQDDLEKVLAEVAEADAIVLGTPVYMWQMCGQLKLACDRFYSFLDSDFTSRLVPGKKVLIVVTQGQHDITMFTPYFESFSKMLTFLGFGEVKTLVAGGTRLPGEVAQQQLIMGKARQMGEWLAK